MSLKGYIPKQQKAPWFRALKRKPDPVKRRYIRPVSQSLRAVLYQYRKLRVEFLSWNPNCHCCRIIGQRPSPATEIHHRRGRGKFMLATDTWSALCADCHRYVHDHPAWAYKVGLLEKRGEVRHDV